MSRPQLEAFNETATCPKCGYADIGVAWEKDAHHRSCTFDAALDFWDNECCEFEHIERWCKRCHYRWAEAPITSAAIAKATGSTGETP